MPLTEDFSRAEAEEANEERAESDDITANDFSLQQFKISGQELFQI